MRKSAFAALVAIVLIAAPSARSAATRAEGGFKVDTGSQCVSDRAFLATVADALRDDPLLSRHLSILSDNELVKGCGALQVVDAQMESRENGLSIGPNQLDLNKNKDAGWALLTKLREACSKEVSPSLRLASADDQFFNRTVLTRRTDELRRQPDIWPSLLKLRPKLEALLRTQCGQQELRQTYLKKMEMDKARAMETYDLLVAKNPDLANQSTFLQLYALDYGNVNGDLSNFEVALSRGEFCGPKLCVKGGRPAYRANSPPIVTDVLRYALDYTCWGAVIGKTRRHDALRRLNIVLATAPLDTAVLSQADKAWLTGPLTGALGQAESDFGAGARFPHIEKLVGRLGGVVRRDLPPTSPAAINSLATACAK